ncbi:MAG: hypothetical protein V4663_15415 [Bacteroidota bacterium]
MYYIKQPQDDINFKSTSITVIYLELDVKGNSVREVAFNAQNNVVHRFPSNHYKEGTYGLFEFSPYSIDNLTSDLSKAEFEEIWNANL